MVGRSYCFGTVFTSYLFQPLIPRLSRYLFARRSAQLQASRRIWQAVLRGEARNEALVLTGVVPNTMIDMGHNKRSIRVRDKQVQKNDRINAARNSNNKW